MPTLRAGIETLSIPKKGSIASWRHGLLPAAAGANVGEWFGFDGHVFSSRTIAFYRNVHAFLQPSPTIRVASIPQSGLPHVSRTSIATI